MVRAVPVVLLQGSPMEVSSLSGEPRAVLSNSLSRNHSGYTSAHQTSPIQPEDVEDHNAVQQGPKCPMADGLCPLPTGKLTSKPAQGATQSVASGRANRQHVVTTSAAPLKRQSSRNLVPNAEHNPAVRSDNMCESNQGSKSTSTSNSAAPHDLYLPAATAGACIPCRHEATKYVNSKQSTLAMPPAPALTPPLQMTSSSSNSPDISAQDGTASGISQATVNNQGYCNSAAAVVPDYQAGSSMHSSTHMDTVNAAASIQHTTWQSTALQPTHSANSLAAASHNTAMLHVTRHLDAVRAARLLVTSTASITSQPASAAPLLQSLGKDNFLHLKNSLKVSTAANRLLVELCCFLTAICCVPSSTCIMSRYMQQPASLLVRLHHDVHSTIAAVAAADVTTNVCCHGLQAMLSGHAKTLEPSLTVPAAVKARLAAEMLSVLLLEHTEQQPTAPTWSAHPTAAMDAASAQCMQMHDPEQQHLPGHNPLLQSSASLYQQELNLQGSVPLNNPLYMQPLSPVRAALQGQAMQPMQQANFGALEHLMPALAQPPAALQQTEHCQQQQQHHLLTSDVVWPTYMLHEDFPFDVDPLLDTEVADDSMDVETALSLHARSSMETAAASSMTSILQYVPQGASVQELQEIQRLLALDPPETSAGCASHSTQQAVGLELHVQAGAASPLLLEASLTKSHSANDSSNSRYECWEPTLSGCSRPTCYLDLDLPKQRFLTDQRPHRATYAASSMDCTVQQLAAKCNGALTDEPRKNSISDVLLQQAEYGTDGAECPRDCNTSYQTMQPPDIGVASEVSHGAWKQHGPPQPDQSRAISSSNKRPWHACVPVLSHGRPLQRSKSAYAAALPDCKAAGLASFDVAKQLIAGKGEYR